MNSRSLLAVALALSLAAHALLALSGGDWRPMPLPAPATPSLKVMNVTVASPPASAPLPAASAHPAPTRGVRKPAARKAPPPPTFIAEEVRAAPGTPGEPSPEPSPEPPAEPAATPQAVALAASAAAMPTPTASPDPPAAAVPDNLRKRSFASRIEIAYRATSNVLDGFGSYSFTRDGDQYTIEGTLQAEGFFAEAFVGQLRQRIEGAVTAHGLRPHRLQNHAAGNNDEDALLDWQNETVRFSRRGESRSEVLRPDALDVLSLLFSFDDGLPSGPPREVQVVTARGQNPYQLEVLGETSLDLAVGPTRTTHVRLTARNGRSHYEAWLAPALRNLPVRLRFPAARGRIVFEMSATQVHIEG